jgi:hypothetical protein
VSTASETPTGPSPPAVLAGRATGEVQAEGFPGSLSRLTDECQRRPIWHDPPDGRYRILYGSIDAKTLRALVKLTERWRLDVKVASTARKVVSSCLSLP